MPFNFWQYADLNFIMKLCFFLCTWKLISIQAIISWFDLIQVLQLFHQHWPFWCHRFNYYYLSLVVWKLFTAWPLLISLLWTTCHWIHRITPFKFELFNDTRRVLTKWERTRKLSEIVFYPLRSIWLSTTDLQWLEIHIRTQTPINYLLTSNRPMDSMKMLINWSMRWK